MEAVRHPAKFHRRIIAAVATWLQTNKPKLWWVKSVTCLDPFAGVGRITTLREHGYCGSFRLAELEPEWARQIPTIGADRLHVGDGCRLPWGEDSISFGLTSPCYGNRMADDHTPSPEDTSRRNTYRHSLGRPLSEGSAAGLQWGGEYRALHSRAWNEAYRVLVPGGVLLVNLKDHIRAGERVEVTEWHARELRRLGFTYRTSLRIDCPGLRQGANEKLRMGYEEVLVFEKPEEFL